MSMAESYRPESSYNPIKKEHTIFDFYSVKNHVLFLRKISNIPDAEKRFYLQEDVLKFLAEFVEKVPYTKISYQLKPDGLEYGGINIARVYQEAADKAGFNSREYFDNEGFKKIHKEFALGRDNIAFSISPPISSDYGFVYLWTKEKDEVSEYLLRFDEERGKLDKSNKILRVLTGQSYEKPEDFVTNPITYLTDNANTDLKLLLTATGIRSQDIQTYFQFEAKVKKTLSPWIDFYINRVIELAQQNFPVNSFDVYEKELETILAAIYNKARDIKEGFNLDFYPVQHVDKISPKQESLMFYDLGSIYNAAESRPLKVSGGDCPVTEEKTNEYGFTSPNDIIKALSNNATVESLVKPKFDAKNDPGLCQQCPGKEPHFHCPKCPDKVETDRCAIIVGEHTQECPKCKTKAACQ